ncbi:glycosyltransferase family 4 protein [Naumannella halotolerans]|uniref:glycosyltransferase family 4 protein n=1 Tax=Naumannella halotolerans TaxID=993414 RepID=UPI00370D623A
MRILVLTQHFPPEGGPHAYRWGWLTKAFAERGHEVDVVVPRWRADGEDTEESVVRAGPGVRVHETAARVSGVQLRRRLINELLTAAAAYRAGRGCGKVDVIIGTVPSLPTLPVAIALGLRTRTPTVAEIRDAWPDLLGEWEQWGDTGTARRRPRAGQLVRRVMRRIVPVAEAAYTALQRRAGLVVTTTESWARVLRRRRMRRVVVIRNTSMAISEPLPLPPARPGGALHVLYVGNFGRAQHLATAIRAASLCHQEGVPVRLRLVGVGAEAEAMRSFNSRLGQPAEIFDRVGVDEVPALYDWADSVLVTLRAWQPMEWSVPSKLYEALTSGRHITVTAPGESATIVEHAKAGHAVPPENPEALAALWTRMANDRSLLRPETDLGAAWVRQNADPDELAERYLDELELLHHRAAR